MPRNKAFEYPLRGPGRPQILLLGNGLEYESGQRSWSQLVEDLTLPENRNITDVDKLPFPLRYELLSTPQHVTSPLTKNAIENEETRLSNAMGKLVSESNPLLDMVPSLHMDHILTTNYSYCLEKAFFPSYNFQRANVRSKFRCYLTDKREVEYRLHTGYFCENVGTSGTCIWHIHGECSVPQGIILGHDRYGRILSRIINCCNELSPRIGRSHRDTLTLISWPELFLVGDIYILGFGFDESEFDLWWLLRRKQREKYADGRVYYYDKSLADEKDNVRYLLLRANGVNILSLGADKYTPFNPFYHLAMQDIKRRVMLQRGMPSALHAKSGLGALLAHSF